MLRHCTSMRSAVGLGGLAPAVLRCECNGQLDGSRFCKFEKASRLATTARSRTECIRQPTRVCIKLTTCKGRLHHRRRGEKKDAEFDRKSAIITGVYWLIAYRLDQASPPDRALVHLRRAPIGCVMFQSVPGTRGPAVRTITQFLRDLPEPSSSEQASGNILMAWAGGAVDQPTITG